MPGLLVEDTPFDPTLTSSASPNSSVSHLSPLWHYIPVLTRSIMPDSANDASPLPQLCRPAGLNVTSLPDMNAEDGSPPEPGLLLQLSPSSAAPWGCNASPTTMSALLALRQFLPSNFEEDQGQNSRQMDIYSCDEFRMYEFKVRRCMKGRSHDWTECPFAHPGEKARRRDPRRFHYSGTACADFRRGCCKKGDACEHAHGVFECWLHPSRYRTQPCKDGQGCQRRICFFAHTPDQLRPTSPVSSPSALPPAVSRHLCTKDALELCGVSSPIPSPPKKASLESFMPPLTSSPLCHMAMEALSDVCFTSNFSLTSPASLSPPTSSSPLLLPSSPSGHIDWSPRGISALALPMAAAMPKLYSSLHFGQTEASVSPGPVHCGHWERPQQSLARPPLRSQGGSLPSPTPTSPYTVTSKMQQPEDWMNPWKQAYLTEEETEWKAAGSFSNEDWVQWQGGRSGCEAPRRRGCSRTIEEEEKLLGRVCSDEEEGEPKLERVESGKGLRAQIFQSLLSSASQPSCRIYQHSNSELWRSSSSLGC